MVAIDLALVGHIWDDRIESAALRVGHELYKSEHLGMLFRRDTGTDLFD